MTSSICRALFYPQIAQHIGKRLLPRFGDNRVSRNAEVVPDLLQEQVPALHFLRQESRGRAYEHKMRTSVKI